MPARYITMSWDTVHRDARLLAERLMRPEGWRGIVAVTRGGMVPAAIIARELGVRLIESVSIASYQDEQRSEPAILKAPTAAADGEGFLVIDDLVDSGVTARAVRALLPKGHFACLYAKPAGRDFAHSWISEVPQESWLLFPWDTAAQYVPPFAGRD